MKRRANHGIRLTVAVASSLALLAGCSAKAGDDTDRTPSAAASGAVAALPPAHVHAVSRDPGDGALLLATHEGLYRYGPDGPARVGPAIDLMGFAVARAGPDYAAGHPHLVAELPQPMGLIESRDGGRTWAVLSRGGQSDFHALTPAGDTVVAFDGRLRRTSDGRTWSTSSLPGAPRTLASDPEGTTVLATTEDGLLASTDQGATWSPVPGAPLLLQVAWGDGRTVAGVTPDGAVAMSSDGAKSWRLTGASVPPPQAMSAHSTASGFEVLVVTEKDVLSSTDGTTFTAVSR
jgi:hypothetical protein